MPTRPTPSAARPVASGPPERFGSCSRVLYAPPERGPGERTAPDAVEEIPYRRCPVGLIAAVDCPEFAGLSCRHHDPRGDRPKAIVPRAEVAMLASELADGGYLTEAYRRRLRGLRVEVAERRSLPREEGVVMPSGVMPAVRPPVEAPVRRAAARAERAPVNVPSDEARRKAFAARRAARGASGAAKP